MVMSRIPPVVVCLLAAAAFAQAGDLRTAGARAVPGSYIVVLNEGAARGADAAADVSLPTVADVAQDMAFRYGARPTFVYDAALIGFAARMSAERAQDLSDDPRVAYVEEDQVMEAVVTQNNATWGLDRIDQRNLPLNTTYIYTPTGAGVHAYIIDTGIRTTHTQFTGRIGNGFSAITGGVADCNGHGTHVAGTVGGTTYGVAKAVTLHPVRVLNCSGSGTNSGVIAGVNWVRTNGVRPGVANMSLGGGASSALDSAVTNAINAGFSFAVAAGNSNTNASFSNFGSCVDLFAPGSGITSSWSTSNTATNTISGTSMASPHVAGVLALILQGNPGASAATASTTLRNRATTGVLTGIGSGSPNRLLYSR
jgi:aqualysin 1